MSDTVERGSRPLERVADALERRDASVAPPSPELSVTSVATSAPVMERPQAVMPKSPLREDIEIALAEGLEEIYTALPTATQATFRQRGEQLAMRMETMLSGGKFGLRDAYQSLTAWLRLLPSAGKFFRYFLEQEAKVKMDTLLAIARRSGGEKLEAGS
ncbi:hypothetical protein HY480_00520 [Candidatus Uhrbacteria bacterium]|nr:hypothetical protein [Candidatus Uhrbacteria bacterium]